MDYRSLYNEAFFYSTGTELRIEDGVSIERIRQAEAKLKVQFPVALREFYGVAGSVNYVEDSGYWLYSVESVEVFCDYIVFMSDYIAEPFWGVQIIDADQENPLIYFVLWHLDENGTVRIYSQSSAGTVSSFLCGFLRKWSLSH